MTLAPALLWLVPVFDDLLPSANVTALGLLTMPAPLPPAPLGDLPAPGGTNPSARKR